MPKSNRKQESMDLFEEMFEKQVHSFLDQHKHLIDTESNVFEMAKKFDERYRFVIFKGRDEINRKIEIIRERNKIFYQKIMRSRKKTIEEQFEKLQHDIDRSIEEHNNINMNQEEKLTKIYEKNKEQLINQILNELGLNFK
ncbi:MAG: hypothetical protein GY870_07835 [archaeon]|nr:hypothetical protein [archaeon]